MINIVDYTDAVAQTFEPALIPKFPSSIGYNYLLSPHYCGVKAVIVGVYDHELWERSFLNRYSSRPIGINERTCSEQDLPSHRFSSIKLH